MSCCALCSGWAKFADCGIVDAISPALLVSYIVLWLNQLLVVCSGWAKFADWGIVEAINNLAGSVSWFFGIALWITSFNYIRRRWYQVTELPTLKPTMLVCSIASAMVVP